MSDLADITQAAEAAKEALRERDDLIRQAVAQGASLRSVGQAAGMDHRGIKRIVDRAEAAGRRW